MMKNLVTVSSLDVTRGGTPVLHDLDFAVASGQVTGLLARRAAARPR